MTDRPTFKPGDLVERTGPTRRFYGLYNGGKYPVTAIHREGRFISLEGVDGEWPARDFRLVEEGKADGD